MISTSMFGQVPLPVKAGDPAPPLTWTKIVAAGGTAGGPQSFPGLTTVLLFLRPVSHNQQAVSRWNNLVEQFADKTVNFVWVANEPENLLMSFLKDNPVRGWMVLDPKEESYKAYGVEGAAGVLIEPDGKIAGFTFMSPEATEIQAVLDGQAVAVKGDLTEQQKDAFFEGKAVRLEAAPFHRSVLPQKPNLVPSDEVHISLSQTEGTISSSGPDHWMQRGFDLKAILSTISSTSPSRVELPKTLDNETRYDFVLVLPQPESEEEIHRKVRNDIERYFHVSVTSEIRSVDVYVITAPAGKTPPRKSGDEVSGGYAGFTSQTFTSDEILNIPEGDRTRAAVEKAARETIESPRFRQALAMAQLTGMTALSSSMDEFQRALEDGLHCPVVDETGLSGDYDFQTHGTAQTTEEFLSMLRDQLGLVVTPARRNIAITVVRSVE